MSKAETVIRKKPELLLPAGSPDTLRTAVKYGADAVYMGGEAFSLRASAKNFTSEQMAEGISFARENGVKVYVTANILAHNEDLEKARVYFRELRGLTYHGSSAAPDAVLVADPALFMIARQEAPELELHISTQANNTNYGTFRFWHDLGASRVVTARELSLKEIREIRANIPDDLEIESFVHGAMCISYSGRCLLSNYLAGRDANRGACTHPCRWNYAVMEEKRPGEYMPVVESERGTFIFNSKDLCMVEHLPDLIDAGVDSLKIEGRMKTALYVATAARTYRVAIDDCTESLEKYESKMDWYRSEIRKCTYREFTTGFFYGKPNRETQIYETSTYVNDYVYLGTAGEEVRPGFVRLEQKNKFSVGETLEIMRPDGTNTIAEVLEMRDLEGGYMESCPHASQTFDLRLSQMPASGEILRREKTE